jgi:aldehyde dehydrogenase (NAD+)
MRRIYKSDHKVSNRRRVIRKTDEQFYINGEWVDPVEGKNMFDVLNPSNEEVIGQIAMGSSTDVDNAVKAASKAFDSFSQTTVEER